MLNQDLLNAVIREHVGYAWVIVPSTELGLKAGDVVKHNIIIQNTKNLEQCTSLAFEFPIEAPSAMQAINICMAFNDVLLKNKWK